MFENLMLSLLDLVLTIPQIVFTLLFYVAEPLLWVAIPLFALEQLLKRNSDFEENPKRSYL